MDLVAGLPLCDQRVDPVPDPVLEAPRRLDDVEVADEGDGERDRAAALLVVDRLQIDALDHQTPGLDEAGIDADGRSEGRAPQSERHDLNEMNNAQQRPSCLIFWHR